MPISRIFQAIPLQINSRAQLDTQAAHHVARVLRSAVGDKIIIFNDTGEEFEGIIDTIDKKNVTVLLQKKLTKRTESPLEIYLAQGISRGEKMDFTIQKAVELGVKKIFPLFTEFCNVKLESERRKKKLQHWNAIIVSACEQSGRNIIPEIVLPESLENFLEKADVEHKFVLAPNAEKKLSEFKIEKNAKVILLIGPEGGLSEREIELAQKKNFHALNLGPRILRTETAGIAAITALQCYAGDMG